jgi:hypothetical protein
MTAGKLGRSFSLSPSSFDDSHRPEQSPGLPEHEENAGQMITHESEEVQATRTKFQAYSLLQGRAEDHLNEWIQSRKLKFHSVNIWKRSQMKLKSSKRVRPFLLYWLWVSW